MCENNKNFNCTQSVKCPLLTSGPLLGSPENCNGTHGFSGHPRPVALVLTQDLDCCILGYPQKQNRTK